MFSHTMFFSPPTNLLKFNNTTTEPDPLKLWHTNNISEMKEGEIMIIVSLFVKRIIILPILHIFIQAVIFQILLHVPVR